MTWIQTVPNPQCLCVGGNATECRGAVLGISWIARAPTSFISWSINGVTESLALLEELSCSLYNFSTTRWGVLLYSVCLPMCLASIWAWNDQCKYQQTESSGTVNGRKCLVVLSWSWQVVFHCNRTLVNNILLWIQCFFI